MKNAFHKGVSSSGFTLLELMVTLAILAILATFAVPAFSSWLPEYRLKCAVRDLYSNMHLAKMTAIKANESYRLVFNNAGEGYYILQRPDEITEKSISFLDYDSNGNIGYGCGNATKAATSSGGSLPSDFISYQYNKAVFNSRGTGSPGYVYLANSIGTVYAIGTWSSGIIVIKKWNEESESWE